MDIEPLFPLGHYYSPFPDPEEIERDEDRIFADTRPEQILGIDLRTEDQLETIRAMAAPYADVPWDPCGERTEGLRYAGQNDFFGCGDAIVLYCMLRKLRPARVIEVGCGWSSACMLDTNERFLDRVTSFTFIEPYPERLHSLLSDEDRAAGGCRIVEERVQDVALSTFEQLGDGDLLFIDSSHVLRCGGDVNHILFEILPRLAPGVMVHFHDILWPFEYPRAWVLENRGWNEAYALRALLQGGSGYSVHLWTSMLAAIEPERLRESLPLVADFPGGSLYLRRER